MASLRRKTNTRYWIACFTDANGIQRQVSTKEISRAKAQKIAEKFESAWRGKMTEAQARKVLADIYETVRGEKLLHATTRTFLTNWLSSKAHEMANGSLKRYQNAVDKLLDYLGPRADTDIAYVDKKDLLTLRDQTAAALTASTANTDLKILRIAFTQAVNDGLRLDNPAKAIKALRIRKEPGEPSRRPFTDDELKKLQAVLTGEWLGMFLFGLYTGQRLGDIATLHWNKVDLGQRLIDFRTSKTDRLIVNFLADPLFDWLQATPEDKRKGPIFPQASQEKFDANGESRRLSAKFYAWLVKAGLAEKRSKKNTGRGHSVKRKVSELSFHSLRHTLNSWLKKLGVPEAVVRDIIGHDSELVSRAYTHIDSASKQAAMEKLPKL
jgi:integrase